MSSSSTIETSSSSSPFPYATAPDIIRAHQKDAYFAGYLTNTLTDLHRRLRGARATHAVAPELRTVSSLLYFGLTTFPGNRTLGEEYCDLVQVDASEDGKLPGLKSRAAYIAGSILAPYLAGRVVPSARSRVRKLLESRINTLRKNGKTLEANSREAKMWDYMLRNLSSLTSSAPIQAVTLSLFYFTGTYYELTKRLLSLRYVFTRTTPESAERAGYEVLGVLLAFQLAVQGYLHVKENFLAQERGVQRPRERNEFESADVMVTLSHDNAFGHENSDLLLGSSPAVQKNKVDIATTTHTPVGTEPRFSLTDDKVMGYIRGAQQRKCTLCLDELKDPSATQCGHVFCWECIGDWVREKPECPLCRREALVQHILPLRVV